MNSKKLTIDEALKQAQTSLQNNDRYLARKWAQRAAFLAPDREEPWLILARIASPHARLAYLQIVLEKHPGSPAALQTLRQLRDQDRQSALAPTQPTRVTQAKKFKQSGALRAPGKHLPGSKAVPSIAGIFILLAVLLVGWLTWEDRIPRVSSAYIISPPAIVTPTTTASPTTTSIPTATQTATASPTLTPTPLPSPTATLAPSPSPSPVPPTPTPGAKSIVVDISDQRVYAYEGSQLIFNYPASTGENNSTLTGQFSILDKEPDAYSDPWGFWMPDWMGIYYASEDLENGFHSLPVLPNGSTLWGNLIGTPITYGCVVLEPGDMQALYQWANIGTPVTIRP